MSECYHCESADSHKCETRCVPHYEREVARLESLLQKLRGDYVPTAVGELALKEQITQVEKRIYEIALVCDKIPALKDGHCPEGQGPRDNLTRIRLGLAHLEDYAKRMEGEALGEAKAVLRLVKEKTALKGERDKALGQAADEKHRADSADERWRETVISARTARDKADGQVDGYRTALERMVDKWEDGTWDVNDMIREGRTALGRK